MRDFSVSASAKAWLIQCKCVYIYIVHIWMVVLPNPGTYGTRKCSSWCADIHKDLSIQKSNIPKIPKNPKIRKSNKNARFRRCKKFWIFGFLDSLCFTLVFSICRNSSKIGFGKKDVCIGILSVFKGCACRWGGVTIYMYVCVRTYI